MNNSYQELMQRVEVTPEMRKRILSRLKAPSKKPLRVPRQALLTAACLVLVCTLSILLLPRQEPAVTEPPMPGVGVVSPFLEVSSAEELSAATGVALPVWNTPPFPVETVSYWIYSREIAEVRYLGSAESAVFRKAAGSEDLSGNYTTYETVLPLSLPGFTGELRGSGMTYTQAVWQSADETFYLNCSIPQTEEVFLAWIEEFSL